ncbi:MAG: hypothetical protein ABSG95_01425 [Solirubrobacteraceae bacterium]|jgi:hypothetical protein
MAPTVVLWQLCASPAYVVVSVDDHALQCFQKLALTRVQLIFLSSSGADNASSGA